MPKVFRVLFLTTAILFFISSPIFTQKALAATCTFRPDPLKPVESTGEIKVIVNSNYLKGGTYRLMLKYPNNASNQKLNLSFTPGVPLEVTFEKPPYPWNPGNYRLYFKDQSAAGLPDQNLACSPGSFPIGAEVQACEVKVKNTPPLTPDQDILLSIKGLSPSSSVLGVGGYDLFVNGNLDRQISVGTGETEVNLGKKEATKGYRVEIKSRCYGIGPVSITCIQRSQHLECPATTFIVRPVGSKADSGSDIYTGDTTSSAGQRCYNSKGEELPYTIATAIGCVPTEPSALINGFLRVAMGASGGVALLLMIAGSYQMIMSAGNPESVKKGQQQFTSAIIGLMFTIFSVLLLQVIGVDILQIPGFKR